tara:strand:+ start:434 stop:628 length:195 start_codon:yes stop_codon:yes gene_type:complete
MENYSGLFGIDVAIKKLRPGAEFAIYNRDFIEWNCPNGSQPPSWDDIMEQVEDDQSQLNTSTEA